MQPKPFAYDTLQQLQNDIESLGLNMPLARDTAALGRSLTIAGKDIPNRFAAQPLEGNDAYKNGAPSENTIARYIRLAQGGWGMIWVESTSICESGRSDAAQLYLHEETLDSFKEMVRKIRAESGLPSVYLVLQLTHSGRNSKPNGIPEPVAVCEHPVLAKEGERIISDEELAALEDDFVRTALLAEKAGFDAVDIRACHGYLVDSLLAAHTRKGLYGGSFENRTRFIKNIVEKLHKESDITIAARLTFFDGIPYPYGWGSDCKEPAGTDSTEPVRLVKELYDRGVRLFNTSAGIGIVNPYLIRPYDSGPFQSPEHQLEGVARQMHFAGLAKQAAPDSVVIASAFTWLREYAPNIAAGGISDGWFDVAGFGRATLPVPDYPNRVLFQGGLKRENLCVTCSGCSTLVKSGKLMHCVMKEKLKG